MPSKPVVSPEDQNATFVELFFDLVFVYSVTQVVRLLHHDFGWHGAGQAVLVFWLIWWAWTQFTWTLNSANTEHTHIEFWTLTATAVAFFMAVAVPNAFHGSGLAFAVPYVVVKSIGHGLHVWVSWGDPQLRNPVRTYSAISVGGMAAVLAGGIAGHETQYWLWGMAILLDVIAAAVGAHMDGWELHPEHFAERHGLFVIIALGETLIVTASGLAGTAWTLYTCMVAVMTVALICALWWTYFPRSKPRLEEALASCKGTQQSAIARDAFSLMHFPMICGVIAFAAAVEDVALHPGEPIGATARIALALGLLLFVGGMAGAMWRATCGKLLPRVAIVAATAVLIVALEGVSPLGTLSLAFAGTAVIGALEQRSADS